MNILIISHFYDQLFDKIIFDDKVENIITSCEVDNNVYNGRKKVTCTSHNFMSMENIAKAFKSIKIKNCEGLDRISQRVLVWGNGNTIETEAQIGQPNL